MDAVAPAHRYFLNWLEELQLLDSGWKVEKLGSNFEQYFTYERLKELVSFSLMVKNYLMLVFIILS